MSSGFTGSSSLTIPPIFGGLGGNTAFTPGSVFSVAAAGSFELEQGGNLDLEQGGQLEVEGL